MNGHGKKKKGGAKIVITITLDERAWNNELRGTDPDGESWDFQPREIANSALEYASGWAYTTPDSPGRIDYSVRWEET